MPNLNVKARVHLSAEQRRELEAICRRQSVGAVKLRRARILLLADEDHPSGRRPDWQIAEVVGLSERQVVRVRQQFVREGEQALDRKPRPSVPGKLDGKAEATLVTLCCSRPPDGHERWTLQLLCDELGRLQVVESVCRETVRKCLKKTGFNPGGRSGSALRKQTGRGSSRGWKKSSIFTKRITTDGTH
jgi:transposase